MKRCLAGWLLCLADEAAECAKEERRRLVGEGADRLPRERPDLPRSACLARCARRWSVMRTASDRAADAPAGVASEAGTEVYSVLPTIPFISAAEKARMDTTKRSIA